MTGARFGSRLKRSRFPELVRQADDDDDEEEISHATDKESYQNAPSEKYPEEDGDD